MRHMATLAALLALLLAGGTVSSHADFAPIALKRGVSIHEWLN